MSRRAVSPVLGLALLVGMVAVASISLLLISTAITSSTQSTIDDQQAQRSLAEFADTAERLAKGTTDEGTYELAGARDGTLRALPDDGDEISIRVADGNGTTIFWTNKTLGSVVYDAPDGSQYAFQAGGVWHVDGYGQSIMIEPPPFHYREDPEPTLTFPVVLVRDEFSATGTASGTMHVQDRTRHYPDEPTHFNPLRNGSVTVSVDSLYCEGWEQYFRERTDGSVTESCETQGVTSDSEVRIELSVPFEIDGFQQGAQFNQPIDGSYVVGNYSDAGHSLQSPTRIVTAMLDDCESRGTALDGNTTIDEPGLYCAEDGEMTGDAAYEIDTSDGDVEIAVDGDFYDSISGDNAGLEIVGDGNVSVFVDGDAFIGNGKTSNVFGNASDPSQFRLYCASGNKFGDNSNVGTVYGLVYAPTCDVDLQGNFQLRGGLMANSAELKGSGEVHIDESVTSIRQQFTPGDANLYFLHISENRVVFEDD